MKFRQSLFWDTKLENIDKEKNKRYIIERVLEFGDDKEIKMIFQKYKAKDIKEVAEQSRSVSPMTRNYWDWKFKFIGITKTMKEESSSAGIRRIKAVLE